MQHLQKSNQMVKYPAALNNSWNKQESDTQIPTAPSFKSLIGMRSGPQETLSTGT